MRNIPDYHVHSSVSPDSHESYSNILNIAQKNNLSELMLTEHFEFFPVLIKVQNSMKNIWITITLNIAF